jgi:protein ImuB
LSIYLPCLPLEALHKVGDPAPGAVFEDEQGIRKVLIANAEARAAGIGPGLPVNAAMALQPELKTWQRDPEKEQRTLRGLAGWSEKFTSFVSIEPPAMLLLEIAGSLKLFDGLVSLRRQIASGLEQQGFAVSIAAAPTPLAATWLARGGRQVCIRDERKLTGSLSSLPLTCLDWPTSVYESLVGMGVSCVGDCLRLPRQGFAKRFGACRLLELDRALGRLPDPRASFRIPERFSAEYELCEEQSSRELILNACRELLLKLEQFLLTRQLAVQRIQLSFFHLQGSATSLTLGCVQADRAVKHWFELLGIRFDHLVLPAPVIAIRLRAGQSQPFSTATDGLSFARNARQRQESPMTHLVERLSARIGSELVHGVTTVAEHRPQYAWRPRELLKETFSAPEAANTWYDERLRRPLWMLPEPTLLSTEEGQPQFRGSLKLLDGPERLETGWWDGDGISRDYFVAENPQGACLWVYRDRSDRNDRAENPAWYLHGIFG